VKSDRIREDHIASIELRITAYIEGKGTHRTEDNCIHRREGHVAHIEQRITAYIEGKARCTHRTEDNCIHRREGTSHA
jgi:hypothetical protein